MTDHPYFSDATRRSSGGGINNQFGTINFINSIIAANTGPTGPDCLGNLASEGHNLVQDTSGCTIAGDLTGNITGQAPLLGPLRDNGGPTFTHALLAGSPAIDAGDDSAAPATDQRGVARPQGPQSDIGAFEVAFADLGVSQSVSPDPVILGADLTFTLTVTNRGPSDATGVILTDTLPAGVGFVSAEPGPPICNESVGTVTCTLGGIPAGSSVTVTIVVVAPSSQGQLTNTVSVTGNETDPVIENTSAAITTQVVRQPLPIPSVGIWGMAIMVTASAVLVAWRSRRRGMRV